MIDYKAIMMKARQHGMLPLIPVTPIQQRILEDMSVNAIETTERPICDSLYYGFGMCLVSDSSVEHINLDSMLKNEGASGINSHISTETRVSE